MVGRGGVGCGWMGGGIRSLTMEFQPSPSMSTEVLARDSTECVHRSKSSQHADTGQTQGPVMQLLSQNSLLCCLVLETERKRSQNKIIYLCMCHVCVCVRAHV